MGEQPIFTTQAHVFQIDPETKRSWLPVSKHAVPVSYYVDAIKNSYRVVAIDGSKVIINCILTSAMVFTKTSQKFGQWSEGKASTVYGLGFASEQDLSKFEEQFNDVKLAISRTLALSNVTYENLPSPTASAPVSRSVTIQSNKSPGLNGHRHASSGSIRSASSTSSFEDETASASDSQRSANSSTESHLKYENDRLKKALAQSSSNAKKWEAELQTLKNNNARLTAALQESTVNVEKWKEQLSNYKEENTKLRKQVSEKEWKQRNSETEDLERQRNEARRECAELEEQMHRKDEELAKLSVRLNNSSNMAEKNSALSMQIQELQSENRLLRQANKQLEERTRESAKNGAVFNQCEDLTKQMHIKLKELVDINERVKSLMVT